METEKELKYMKTQSQICWPKITMNGTLQTRSKIEKKCPLTEETPLALPFDEAKGIKGRSLLLHYPGFDFVTSIPTEYMHSVCIGLVNGF